MNNINTSNLNPTIASCIQAFLKIGEPFNWNMESKEVSEFEPPKTNKMTITIQKTIHEEIELESDFPLFRHKAPVYYKILSLKEVVMLYNDEHIFEKSVQSIKNPSIISAALLTGNVITENEFVDAFVKTVHFLNDIVKEPVQQTVVQLAESIYEKQKTA